MLYDSLANSLLQIPNVSGDETQGNGGTIPYLSQSGSERINDTIKTCLSDHQLGHKVTFVDQ